MAHLGALPAGLVESEFSPAGDSLLNYTPPNVQWQAPLAPTGGDIFSNYVMTSRSRREPTAESPNPWFGKPDLLSAYNRRLARFGGEGGLPESPSLAGQPETMSEYGLRHWNEFGGQEGRELVETTGPFGGAALWSDPGRSPYLGYPGGVRSGGGTTSMAAVGGRLPQPSVEGYEYAYPVLGWQEDAGVGGQYVPGVWGGTRTPEWDYYTQNIDEFPYFPYAPGDIGTPIDGADYISVGQSLLPTSDYPSDRSGWGDVFRYTAGQWY